MGAGEDVPVWVSRLTYAVAGFCLALMTGLAIFALAGCDAAAVASHDPSIANNTYGILRVCAPQCSSLEYEP